MLRLQRGPAEYTQWPRPEQRPEQRPIHARKRKSPLNAHPDTRSHADRHAPWIAGLALVIAALVLGAALNAAVDRFREADRYVSVKGLAEREVPADVAIWPVAFAATGDTPSQVQAGLAEAETQVRAFLEAEGFRADEVGKSPPRLIDNANQGYGRDAAPAERFRAELTLTLRSGRVDAVRDAAQRADELVRAGVVLAAQWGDPVQYLFTGLNDIKPEMIAEATRNARDAARQFAADSGSAVSGIRRASQGYFSISDRDQYTPEIKTVRVVNTVDYFLGD